MDDLDKAKIAIEEYKVLHAELLQRNSILLQVTTAGIAAIVTLIGFMAAKTLPATGGVFLLVVVGLALGLAWKLIDSDARHACKRLIEIEEYVNQKAGDQTNTLLSWERRFGILARTYADRLRRFNFDDQSRTKP